MNGELKMDLRSSHGEHVNVDHFTRMILPNINDFRKTMKYCDIKIVIDGVEYAAHKVMLAGFSPYFKTLFSGTFPESKESCIEMNSFDSSTMELILDYAYTGTIEITLSNVEAVLHASSFLQVTQLFEECCNFLINNINSSNCLNICRLAQMYSCSNLEKKAREHSLKNFFAVSQAQEYLELDVENLVDLIGNDALRVREEREEDENKISEKMAEKSEELVFEAVVRWLTFKEDERTSVLAKVLAQVRLAYLSPWYIFDRVESVNAIRNSSDCMALVVRALYYSLLNNRKTELQSSISRRRNNWPHVEVLLVYGKDEIRQERTMKCIAEDGSFVKEFAQPPVDFECHFVSNYHNQCIGVHRENLWYTRNSAVWNQVVPMPKKRYFFGIAELDGLWFVIGGETDSGVCDDVLDYNNCGSWRSLAPLPVAVSKPSVVALRGRIYVLGGSDKNGQPINLVQRYDPRNDSWIQLSPLPGNRGELKVCVLNDDIYACSFLSNMDGEDYSARLYVYNVAKNEWRPCTELSQPFVSGPVSFNGNLFFLMKKSDKEHVLQKFTPITVSWEELAIFPSQQSLCIAGPLLINRRKQM